MEVERELTVKTSYTQKTKTEKKKKTSPHLGEQVSGLELAKVGVALDGGRGCLF